MDPTPNLHPNPDDSEAITIIHADSFISRALLYSLRSSNPKYTISTEPGWILSPSELRSSIDGSETVFHVDPTLSAIDGGHIAEGDQGWYDKYEMIVGGTRDVVRVCLECGVKRLVYCGSTDVVFDGVCDIINGNEDLKYPDKYLDAVNDLRAQAEMLVLDANGRDGLSTCVLRISNPFGPGDNHLVPFLVGKAKSTWSKLGISATAKSFLLAEIDSTPAKQGFVKRSKAELFLGSGKVAAILLWKDEKRTFACVMGLFLLFHWFFFTGRNFITSVANLLMLVSTILFCYGYLPSSMMGHKIVKIPSSFFEVPEYAVKQPLLILASMWNKSLIVLESMSQEGNWDVFLKVVGSLCFFKLLLAFSFSTLLVLAGVCLFSFFIIYEQCEEDIEKLANISSSGLMKTKEFLSTKLSSLIATYVHKS